MNKKKDHIDRQYQRDRNTCIEDAEAAANMECGPAPKGEGCTAAKEIWGVQWNLAYFRIMDEIYNLRFGK